MAGSSRNSPAWSHDQVDPAGQSVMALALTGSARGGGPGWRRQCRRSKPSACKMAHTVWADTGSPSALMRWAIWVTEWSWARSWSTRVRIRTALPAVRGPGLEDTKNRLRPARSSAASWCESRGMRLPPATARLLDVPLPQVHAVRFFGARRPLAEAADRNGTPP